MDTPFTVTTVSTLAVRDAPVEVLCGFSETVVQEQKSDIKHVKMVPCYLTLPQSGPLKQTPLKGARLVIG